jgi:glycosyltransferase involved in cell wall biosynthesis
MRIGVDAACLANGRGYGRFAHELLHAMVRLAPEEEFVCFADAAAAARFDLASPNVRLTVVPQSTPPAQAASANGSRSVSDMLRFTRAVWRERPTVFFSPSIYTYFPLPPGQAAVVTVHDTIAERHPELTLPSSRARLFWNMKVRLALAQAKLVLTVSDYSKREINTVLGVPADRIRVATEAPASAYRPAEGAEIEGARASIELPPGARWFIYVGGFNPHKHVDDVVRAHAAVVRTMPKEKAPHLLLVGSLDADVFHGSQPAIRGAIEECGTTELVHWLGFVPDEALRPLLAGALALVMPSEREGFGLPAVEAAACGTPVIATTESPLPDLLEGGGLFVRPRDAHALVVAMKSLATDESRRRALGARARERAAALDWTQGARSALAALREAVNGGRA